MASSDEGPERQPAASIGPTPVGDDSEPTDDASEPTSDASAPAGAASFGDETLRFPVSFDLRIIYTLASGATLEEDALRILVAAHANPARPTALPAPGVTYGRLSVPVAFSDRESMNSAYAALGALQCVKAVL